jgi:D-proline reductase (dithiol) PrdB
MERRGIATIVLSLLRDVTEAVGPPRALCVPFRHGYPLDVPSDAPRQRRVIEAALALLSRPRSEAPVLVDYAP